MCDFLNIRESIDFYFILINEKSLNALGVLKLKFFYLLRCY